jgi:hypothetical protein
VRLEREGQASRRPCWRRGGAADGLGGAVSAATSYPRLAPAWCFVRGSRPRAGVRTRPKGDETKRWRLRLRPAATIAHPSLSPSTHTRIRPNLSSLHHLRHVSQQSALARIQGPSSLSLSFLPAASVRRPLPSEAAYPAVPSQSTGPRLTQDDPPSTALTRLYH